MDFEATSVYSTLDNTITVVIPVVGYLLFEITAKSLNNPSLKTFSLLIHIRCRHSDDVMIFVVNVVFFVT